jgi:intein/homing endonuclease
LVCTDNHLIKTDQGWKQIKELKSGMTVYLSKSFKERYSGYILENDISQEDAQECILKFGSSTMGQYQKDTIYTTKTKTHGIIQSKTLNALNDQIIFLSIAKSELKKIKNGLQNFKRKVLLPLLNGIKAMRAGSGIPSMGRNLGTIDNALQNPVKCVARNTKQDMPGCQGFVIKTVSNEAETQGLERVYDLTVMGEHEYFANGLLVHNCMDAFRYIATRLIEGSDFLADNT